MDSSVIKNFFSKVQAVGSEGCHEWLASRIPAGYGQFYIHRKAFRAHRVAFEIAYGPIPDGLGIMHTCDNPGCVNPNHLVLGTQKQNMVDMRRKNRASAQVSVKLVEGLKAEYQGKFGDISKLAAKYGLHPKTVGRYLKGWVR